MYHTAHINFFLCFKCFREKISDVPNQLGIYLSHKHYLHATELLVQAVSLGRDTLEGVESLKELSQELEQKKEV